MQLKQCLEGIYSYKHLDKEEESSETSNRIFHHKTLDKEEQTKPTASRKKERIKITVEINEIEILFSVEKISENKSCFFEKINTIDKCLI